jgi:hypothetical protein
MRLDLGPNPDYRDIAKWARTSVTQIARFYDQTHPEESVKRITGFREKPKPKPKNPKEAKRMKESERALKRLQEQVRAASTDAEDPW